jgi:uncharacterized protein (TIGR02996 family)
MTREDALLEAIRAAPADDAPRLVYADWLDEHGDPDRAEFIRLQCLRMRPPANDPQRPAQETRALALLETNWDAWVSPLRECIGSTSPRSDVPVPSWLYQPFRPNALVEFHRGFVRTLPPFSAAAFLPRAGAVARIAAYRELSFWEVGPHASDLAASPHLRGLHAFTASGCGLTDEAARALAAAPWLASLGKLELVNNRLTAACVPELVQGAASLTALDFSGNPIGAKGAAALAASPSLAGLTRLALRASNLSPGAVARLAESPALGQLVSLRLAFNRFGDKGADALLAGRFWNNLQELDVAGCQVSDAALARLRDRFGDGVRPTPGERRE